MINVKKNVQPMQNSDDGKEEEEVIPGLIYWFEKIFNAKTQTEIDVDKQTYEITKEGAYEIPMIDANLVIRRLGF